MSLGKGRAEHLQRMIVGTVIKAKKTMNPVDWNELFGEVFKDHAIRKELKDKLNKS